MDAEHLEYFKAALEGRAMSHPALLRLKFGRLDEAERLLAEAGIMSRSKAGKRYEMHCAQF